MVIGKLSKSDGLSKGEKARKAIVNEAIRQIAKVGFAEASFQRIADRLKVSQSAVLYHFKNRDELLGAVIESILKENHAIVSALHAMDDSGQVRLRKYFRGNLTWAVEHPDQAQILLLLYYLACTDKKYSALYATLVEGGRKRVQEPLLAGQREGVFHLRHGLEMTAELLHDVVVASFIPLVANASRAVTISVLEKKWDVAVSALAGKGKKDDAAVE